MDYEAKCFKCGTTKSEIWMSANEEYCERCGKQKFDADMKKTDPKLFRALKNLERANKVAKHYADIVLKLLERKYDEGLKRK